MKDFSIYYVEKHDRKDYKDKNIYLYSKGKYKTSVNVEELPNYFIKICIRGINYYISLKKIKDVYYRPSFYSKKYRDDDKFFIAFNSKITYDENAFPKNYDIIITGLEIDNIVKKLEEYGYDSIKMSSIKKLIDKKEKWYDYWSKRDWNGDYALTSSDVWNEILSEDKPKQKVIKYNI